MLGVKVPEGRSEQYLVYAVLDEGGCGRIDAGPAPPKNQPRRAETRPIWV